MKRLALFALLVALLLVAPAVAQRLSVTESVHDLSPSGPGTVRAAEGYACFFCHAPHNVLADKAPLWNHELSTQVYAPYFSTSYGQTGQQPQVGSASKLCLSCHDGTVALGQTVSQGLISTSGGLGTHANLGTDLRSTHPFSFATPIVDNGELRTSLFLSPPQTADPLVTLPGGRVECTTCHEPHTPNLDPVAKKFLVRDNSGGQLCLACHDPARSTATRLQGWSTSQHAVASHAVNPGAAGSYATVAGNACLSCHAPHGGGAGGRLLRQAEENTCAACHRGSNVTPALPDVMSAFEGSLFRHPVELAGLHDAAEDAFPLNSNRHAECADCHNAHAAQGGAGAAVAPAVPPALLGASGVSGVDGATRLPRAAQQYEVCFKCHADSAGKPQSASYVAYGRTPYRANFPTVADPYNTRLDFLSTVTRHNVLQPARAGLSPSLRPSMLDLSGNATGASLAAGTYLYCTDCHNHSRARSGGGTAASGPHGSDFEHLLERRYDLEPLPAAPGGVTSGVTYISGLAGTYALCDKCHDIENRLLLGDSAFGQHQKHVVQQQTSCATCHAPHGVQNANPVNHSRLLNPDARIVAPNSFGQLRIDTSARTCSLLCHGKDHASQPY